MTTAIVDYGSGNLHSAAKSFERMSRETGAGGPIVVTADADAVDAPAPAAAVAGATRAASDDDLSTSGGRSALRSPGLARKASGSIFVGFVNALRKRNSGSIDAPRSLVSGSPSRAELALHKSAPRVLNQSKDEQSSSSDSKEHHHRRLRLNNVRAASAHRHVRSHRACRARHRR